MADNHTKTTSSKSLDENNDLKASLPLPKSSEAQILTKLAQNLSESYQFVKQRQQKYNELSAKISDYNTVKPRSSEEWQEVCYAKNKLKRKKKLSASLTSVTDTVNQEKRTRIEGMQLNCRGKLQLNEKASFATKTEKLLAKPPLPPTTPAAGAATAKSASANPLEPTVKVPPPRLKRKLQENVQTIQKLNALAEQLRLEINELKSSLTTERSAVRVLRAQNESETRKWKNEVKKLQNTIELLKKNNSLPTNSTKKPMETALANAENLPNAAWGSLANYEIQRLTNEITALKDANKALEEKKMINCDADRRKAADIRTLKDSYEIRLTQLQKSAKTEISRLLEEIKTKERNIGQLKKDLQVFQTKPQNETKSRNATNNTTNKTTNTKPKKINKKIKQNNETTPDKKEKEMKEANLAQNPIEMKKLKDFELINNTKNLQNNINLKTTKILTNSQNNIMKKPLETNENHTKMLNDENFNNLLKTTTCAHQKEYHSMPHEITAHLLETNTKTQQQNNVHEYRVKDNNSDSDSAVSSAPPSISPQPPPAGLESTDIWQTIRTYTTDIEKLQKDIEMLQNENVKLNTELNLAKEQILESEKTVMEASNSTKLKQLMSRIKFLEEQEHQLLAESAELREQNELLEFRILELEETNDKWSLQSHATPNSSSDSSSQATAMPNNANNNVWGPCEKLNKDDPMQLLFGNNAHHHMNMDSGITSPHSQHHIEDDLNLLDASNEELRRRIANMLPKYTLDEEDKQCLQQVLTLMQQLDMLSQRSGPDSLNTTSSSDEASSLDLVKSRISDYSSASSSSSAKSAYDNVANNTKPSKSTALNTNSRIVATVQPYNSSPQHQHQQQHSSQYIHAPTNTPNDSPRKTSRHNWQSTSLSESGVFVESDFLSDVSENNVCTQTEFEDELISHTAKDLCTELQRLQHYAHKPAYKSTALYSPTLSQLSPNLSEQKRLQYYKERLELLESKVLIYESSGDLQAKRLADRLQREIQLEKQLRELQDRVEFLVSENSTLEEEKCEFEEAENDTRLRLQRLEVELEILSQRNVELEMSREALSAKYKDCRSECLILRDDLAASETQIRHLDEDKQKAKENLEFLHSALPLLIIYNSIISAEPTLSSKTAPINVVKNKMGSTVVLPAKAEMQANCSPAYEKPTVLAAANPEQCIDHEYDNRERSINCACQQREITYLKEEIKNLRHQIKELNSRHYQAMESADTHWVDLEREYKDREEAFRAKEICLKQKIQKLQEVLRDDASAANEKICQQEEAEKQLKCCLVRISKEHRDMAENVQNLQADNERAKEQIEQLENAQKPLIEALEAEKKRNKSLNDEINFLRKLQQETEALNKAEQEVLRAQLFDLKKEFLHVEVTNGELKEEVATLEQQIETMEKRDKEHLDKIRTLTDEVRSKEETVTKLEKRLERSEGFSLAQELDGSPTKRFKRAEVTDLRSATRGLGIALRNVKDTEKELPCHEQFQMVARDVKRLADTLLFGDELQEEVSALNVNDTEATKGTLDPVTDETIQDITEMQEEDSSLSNEQSKEIEQGTTDYQGEDEDGLNEDDNVVTVGMAFLPKITLRDNMLPRFSHFEIKKPICEVPSELRKLSSTPPKEKILKSKCLLKAFAIRKADCEWENVSVNIKCTKLKLKRLAKRLGSMKPIYSYQRRLRIKDVVPALQEANMSDFYQDISDDAEEEMLQRTESVDSFHSLVEEIAEVTKVDASTGTEQEAGAEKFDKETETNKASEMREKSTNTNNIVSKNRGIQVSDEMNTEKLLERIPCQQRCFINMLKASIPHSEKEADAYNISLFTHWEHDSAFRSGLEVLQTFATLKPGDVKTVTIDNYETFCDTISCLHELTETFHPYPIPILQHLQEQIQNQLSNFQTNRIETEFYCTVFYPVVRPKGEYEESAQ